MTGLPNWVCDHTEHEKVNNPRKYEDKNCTIVEPKGAIASTVWEFDELHIADTFPDID